MKKIIYYDAACTLCNLFLNKIKKNLNDNKNIKFYNIRKKKLRKKLKSFEKKHNLKINPEKGLIFINGHEFSQGETALIEIEKEVLKEKSFFFSILSKIIKQPLLLHFMYKIATLLRKIIIKIKNLKSIN